MPALIIPYHPDMIHEVRAIFFESSSKKDFKNEGEKEAFYQKYLGVYLDKFSEYAWVAKSDKILGYVVATDDSRNEIWENLQPHIKVFQEYFDRFPAHLHINCHHESRGLGVGSQLVGAIVNQFKQRQIKGLHIMTASDAANKHFYKKLGFAFESELTFQGVSILFMGKSLSED